jgi:hypothetical protein
VVALDSDAALVIRSASPAWLQTLNRRRRFGKQHDYRHMLTGSKLVAKVRELGDASKSDLVGGCGYVSTKNDGTEP